MAAGAATSIATEPADLQVCLLGPLRAVRAGEELTLGGRRQRAVLARLALAAGSVVAAERVIDDLWNGEPPPSAANTLQSYVSNLRRILGPVPGPAIERVGEGYRLAIEPDQLSSVRFERLVTTASRPTGAMDAHERLAAFDEALALWSGSAIADFADEPWAQGDAVRLEELKLAATEERFALLLDLGQHAVIVGDLESAVVAHPLRERFAAQLVLALYRCGRQAEALRAYERTRSHLGEELGLDPSPELARLAAQVLEQDPALDLVEIPAEAGPGARAPDVRPGDPASTEEAGELVPPPDGPLDLPPAVVERRARTAFVGRRRELAALERAFHRVEDGDRLLVTVSGEAGMGKTRLAQHFATWVHSQGGHVFWGRCSAENLIAYQPAVEAVRTALRSISDARAKHLLGPRPALGILLPDLVGNLDAGTGPSRAERYELYESLADLVGDIATSAPVVFVVDDIQWADRSTLGLIEHLVRSDRSGRLLVVATQRRPAGRPTVELDAMISDLRKDQRTSSVDLQGVEVDEVAELLTAQGSPVSDEVAMALHARTGGNPFFVESLAEHGGDLARTDARALPDSVRDLLDLRLAALDDDAARVLAAAAVIGLRVDLAVLGAVTEMGADALLDVIDLATATGLLAEDEDLGWVTFPHALVRQALVARTTRNREAHLHLRVADALEGRPDVLDRTATVAQHLLAAGRLCPPDRAARAALLAGRDALAILADDEARTWARRAADVLGAAHGEEVGTLRADAELLAATASRHLGDRAAALASVDRVVAHARASGDGVRLALAAQEAALSVAGVGFTFGVVDAGLVALLAEALEALPEEEVALRASLLAWSSIAGNSGTDRPRQIDVAAEAQRLADTIGDPAISALTMLSRRLALAGPPGMAERLELGPTMVAAAEEAEWTELVVVGRLLTVVDTLESDQMRAAEDEIERLAKYIAPFGRPGFDAYELFLRANLALLRGDLDEAERLSARAVELGEPAHAGNAFQARAAQQFLAARDLGSLDEIAPLVQAMAEAYPTMAVWGAAHATCLVATGQVDEARAVYEPILASGVLDLQAESTWYTTVGQLAEVVWAADDPEAGRAFAALIEPYVDRMAVTGMGAVCIGPLARPCALALAASGELDRAIELLERAAERCDRNGLVVWAARTRAELALVLARRGTDDDLERARPLMTDALAVAADQGVRLALHPDEYRLD